MIDTARWPLLVIAIGGILLGGMQLLWVLRRFTRRLFGRPQPPAGLMQHATRLATGGLLFGAGLGSLGLLVGLQGYRAFTDKTLVAQVQCIELSPGKLRLYFNPALPDGTLGVAQTFDLDGEEWTVGGDVLRFRPFLTLLGVGTMHKVTRVEGRWLSAADANAHRPTAHDLGGGTNARWLGLYRDGTRGPLGWLVAGVHGQAVSQLPDRRATYDVFITPNGYIVDKRSL